jgi:hypothetical protein
MHRGHDHHHDHHGGGDPSGADRNKRAAPHGGDPSGADRNKRAAPHGGDPSSGAGVAGAGHNHQPAPRGVVQWQTPHRDAAQAEPARDHGEADLDLVESAFVEAFLDASDPTSFLRLAQVPFEGCAPDGARLALLRVEIDAVADVGSVTPHLGGQTFRYDPLPARMVSRRKRLRFVYYDGKAIRALDLAQTRGLATG